MLSTGSSVDGLELVVLGSVVVSLGVVVELLLEVSDVLDVELVEDELEVVVEVEEGSLVELLDGWLVEEAEGSLVEDVEDVEGVEVVGVFEVELPEGSGSSPPEDLYVKVYDPDTGWPSALVTR